MRLNTIDHPDRCKQTWSCSELKVPRLMLNTPHGLGEQKVLFTLGRSRDRI